MALLGVILTSQLHTHPLLSDGSALTKNDVNSALSDQKADLLLPMQMLVVHYDHITMGHVYAFTVKIFDPKTNPDRDIGQFYGGIPGVKINATVYDKYGGIYQKFSGITDDKGSYSGSMLMPVIPVQQKEFYTVFNASKQGYAPQSSVLPFVEFHPQVSGNSTGH